MIKEKLNKNLLILSLAVCGGVFSINVVHIILEIIVLLLHEFNLAFRFEFKGMMIDSFFKQIVFSYNIAWYIFLIGTIICLMLINVVKKQEEKKSEKCLN